MGLIDFVCTIKEVYQNKTFLLCLMNTFQGLSVRDRHPAVNSAERIFIINYSMEGIREALFDMDLKARVLSFIENLDLVGGAPVEALEVPVDLDEQFGQYSYYKSGGFIFKSESEADKALNAGIARLHNFHYIDAVRAFKMATKLEPTNGLAKSFLALAYVKLDRGAGRYLAAKEISEIKSGRMDKAYLPWYEYIRAYVFRNGDNFLNEEGVLELEEAYKKLVESRPEDLEALTLATYLTYGGKQPDPFHRALQIDPNHLGAHHYLIHHYEEEGSYYFALDHAEVMASIAIDSAHAQHMYGHVLPRFKKWQEAKDQFNLAASIHKNWADKYSFSMSYDWHYAHNLDLMAITYVSFGETEAAVEMFKAGCELDGRACQSLMALAAAEGLLDVIQWYKNKLAGYGTDPIVIEDRLYVANLEAIANSDASNPEVIQQRSTPEFREKYYEFLNKQENELSRPSDRAVQFVFWSYHFTFQEEGLPLGEFKTKDEVLKMLIGHIFDYSDEKVGCASFDGWGKGLLETYRFYKLAKSLGVEDLEERLKTIMVENLGVPYEFQ